MRRLHWIGTSFMRQIIPPCCSFVDSQLKIDCDINVPDLFEEERIHKPSWPFSHLRFHSLIIVPKYVMPFDWHAETAAPTVISTIVRVLSPTIHAIATAHAPMSFAQALTSSISTSSNDNIPQPYIRGEAVCIKISQAPYEKGIEVCKRHLRGRLVYWIKAINRIRWRIFKWSFISNGRQQDHGPCCL